MSDEQIIGTLENIQANCVYHNLCMECRFGFIDSDGSAKCQIKEIAEELYDVPSCWHLGRVKELLKK